MGMGKLINILRKPIIRRKQMEFLIIAALLLVGGYFGYQYYLAKKAAPNVYDLAESVEATVEVGTVEVAAEPVEEEPKKPAKKAANPAAKKTAPAKKKPNIKIAK